MGFTDPDKNIKELNLEPGMTVVDCGAGIGQYALRAARLVGTGKVYAVDIQQELLARLEAEAKAQELTNVEIVWGDLEHVGGSKLADHIADAVILSNTLFQSQARYQTAAEVKRLLKPGGRLLLVEWSDSFNGLGPAAEAVLKPEAAEELFVSAGFRRVKQFLAGDHHYGIIFYKGE